MSEPVATEPTNQEPTPDPIDPRETKAFKAVTRQLAEKDKVLEDLKAKVDAFEQAKEQEELELKKKQGQFEEIEQSYKEKLEAAERRIEEREAAFKKEIFVSDLKSKIASEHGITNPKHLAFLVSEYMAAGEGAEVEKWVQGIATNEDYAVFVKGGKSKLAPPVAPAPSKDGKSLTGAGLKQALTDRSTAKQASRQVTEFYKKHGRLPWSEPDE